MGSALISAVIELTWQQDCRRDWLITTNDNLDALRFYQKHDFYLMALYTNALEASHKFKRGIPITGMMASRCAMSLSWSILYNSWCEADRFAQNNGTPPFASAQRKYHLINGEWLALRKNQGRA